MPTELLEPVVDDGIRLTHFFNGRVLTAEDLRREQDAARDRHRGLAAAVGEGVVRGLEVAVDTRTLPAPAVRVSAGLAFNRDGDPVALPKDVKLRLIPASAEVAAKAGEFALCDAPTADARITNGGFFILAARPAAAFSRDRVASVDLSSDGVGTGCGSRYTEEGAAFSLVPVPVPTGGAPVMQVITQLVTAIEADVKLDLRNDPDPALPLRLAQELSKLRNLMAYWCAGYGAPGQRVLALSVPFPDAPAAPQSPLEVMRAAGTIASCDVPLALLYVTERGLEWADVWSVRRAPVSRVAPDPLELVGAHRPRGDAAAMIMQFRDHASTFLQSSSPVAPESVAAADWFFVLPPVGVLPLQTRDSNEKVLETGFVEETFFPANERSPVVVPLQWAEMLLRRAEHELPFGVHAHAFRLVHFHAEQGETVDWQGRYLMFCSHAEDPFEKEDSGEYRVHFAQGA